MDLGLRGESLSSAGGSKGLGGPQPWGWRGRGRISPSAPAARSCWSVSPQRWRNRRADGCSPSWRISSGRGCTTVYPDGGACFGRSIFW